MSNQPNNSDIWSSDHSDTHNFHEEHSLWPNQFFQDRTHLNQNMPNGLTNSSTIPDFPSIWSRHNDEQNLVNDMSHWSLNQSDSSQSQTLSWNETTLNLPQMSSSNVPVNEVFHNPWSDSSWRPLNQESSSTAAAQNEVSNQETVIQPSNSQGQPQGRSTAVSLSDSNLPTSTQPPSLSLNESDLLLKDRINNPGKWGCTPVKQNTPWFDDEETVRSTGQNQESNVWRSEPPTGTQIWDFLHAGPSTPTASLSGSVTSRISPQAFSNHSQSTFNNWNYPSSGAFSSRSHFGPPGSYRRQMQGPVSTSILRQSNDISNLAGGSMGSHRMNAWSSPTTVNDTSGANSLGQRSNTWGLRSTMDAPPPIGNFLDGHLNRGHSSNASLPTPNYRNNLVAYFTQQGFSRADVEEVLSTGCTDIDQCLAALRTLQTPGNVGIGFRAQRTLTGSRHLSSPTVPSESGSLLGSFSNNHGASYAPFGRGNQVRPTARSISMNQCPIPGGHFNTPTGSCGDDSLMGSLLGRPPAQVPSLPSLLESASNFATTGPSMRNFQPPGSIPAMNLIGLKNEIQLQINEFREKPFIMNSQNGKKMYNDLLLRLQYVNAQLANINSNSGVSGGFGSSSIPNGFRSSRHNSYNDTLNAQGNSSSTTASTAINEENWLLIREMTPSISVMELGSIIDCNILEFHDLPVPGSCLIRVGSAEIAREVKRRCDVQYFSIIPNVVIMSGKEAAGVLLESAKLNNPLPTPVFS